MASGYVSWTTPDGNSPNPVYIDDSNKSVEFSAREDVAPYTITRPVGSVIYTLSNLGIINGFQCYRYAVYVTATTTTTTTTTEPPEITLSTTGTCENGGLEGYGRIVASGFSGGVGSYYSIRIGTSMENAFDATPILLNGATSYQFDGLNSAVWYVLLTDNAGNQGYATRIINCTTTIAPPPPTTSTTTVAPTTPTTSTSTTSTSTTTTTGAPLQFILTYDPSSGTTACSNYPDTNAAIRYAYYTATLGNGIQLFTSNTLTTPVPNGYYSNGTNYWVVTGGAGILNSQVSCTNPCGFNGGTAVYTGTATTAAPTTTTAAPTTTTAAPTTTTAAPTTTTAAPTTTTAGYTTFLITFTSTGDGAQACTDFDTPTNRNPYYAAPGAILTNGTVLYTNTALTTPAANGYYSNGAQYWNTGASTGMLANGTACDTLVTTTTAAPTTTTAAPTFRRSSASANDACTGGLTMTNVILDNTGLCNSNTISCDEFAFDFAGATVWISYAGDVREATINDPNTSGEATFIAACIGCSFVTTTTTTIGPGSLDYDCVGSTCTYVGPGLGTYISLIECQTLSGCS